jgi:ligand-binding SRPBCC domain-containing protein
MGVYKFQTEQMLAIPLQKAWDFFSSPMNLAKITPPEMDFRILSAITDSKVYSGMRITYSVKPILGIPLSWETLISDVHEASRFTDKQIKGPYALWEHTHTFVEKAGGVMVIDFIKYKLPFGVLGDLAHFLFVRKKIKSIFEFRRITLEKIVI